MSRPMRVAALYIMDDSVYLEFPDVDPWPLARDARLYSGPHPVVAHPPCAAWGRYARPNAQSRARGPLVGDDDGCFEAALCAVRRYGGVIEHPRGSKAWEKFGLPGPTGMMDEHGGWTLPVLQSWFGHEAIKPTWLYICGVTRVPVDVHVPRTVRPLEHLSKKQRAATPVEFARFLIGIAQRCGR